MANYQPQKKNNTGEMENVYFPLSPKDEKIIQDANTKATTAEQTATEFAEKIQKALTITIL